MGGVKVPTFELNQGDDEFASFIDPLLNQAGVNQPLVEDVGNRALFENIVQTVGAKLWAAIHSDQWRYREAGMHSFKNYLETINQAGTLPEKY